METNKWTLCRIRAAVTQDDVIVSRLEGRVSVDCLVRKGLFSENMTFKQKPEL